MDRRFERVWEKLQARRHAGEPLPDILKHASSRELIAMLAAGASHDAVTANAIATELLNRQERAPFLGAFLVAVSITLATFVVDTLLTGTPLFTLTASSTRGYVLAALTSGVAAFSLLMYLSWRGKARWAARMLLRARMRRRGGREI